MALRIADIVEHGWIDNTSPGVTKGEVYLLGQEEPIKIFLKGNCWRDVAGSRMVFRNKKVEADEETFATLQHLQKGVVGDVTCSIKRKCSTVPMSELADYFEKGKKIPYEWCNALFIEWFSIANGRVTIESTDYEIQLSEHKWTLSEMEEKQQRFENSHTMNQFMQLSIDMAEAEAEIDFESEDEVDEYEWEKRLRIRDHLDEAQWMLEDEELVSVNEIKQSGGSIHERHILVQLAYQTYQLIGEKLGDSSKDSGPRGGLSGVMSYAFHATDDAWPDKGLGLEDGYRLAVMKRALLACNQAVAHCNTLVLEDDEFGKIREEIHHLRDCIMDTIRNLRKKKKEDQR